MLDAFARRPGRSLGALAALLVAGGAAIGTSASFTTQTVNPTNTFSAGILHVTSSASGAILSADNLVPGESTSGTTTITNTGNVTGSAWTLTQAVTGETPGSDPEGQQPSATLSSRLQLTVDDLTAGTNVYTGALTGLSTASLAAIAPGAPHTFKFTVTLPPVGGAPGSDNGVEGASLTTSYTWSASAGS